MASLHQRLVFRIAHGVPHKIDTLANLSRSNQICCPIVGLDGTRAYASGDFTEAGLIEDISGLDSPAIHAIEDFRLMYRKDYIYLGNRQ